MSDPADWRLTLGASPVEGGVRFRVWAPTTDRVDVVLYGPSAESVHRLDRDRQGYHAGVVEGVGPGRRYMYRLDDHATYPDPASRSQPEGVHGPSEVVDPDAYRWKVHDWAPPAVEDLVIYELHVGTFTEDGTFDAAAERLGLLAQLGVTAVEPMPIAEFSGSRGWGYDGVDLFAPAHAYGGVDGFKRFVDSAHALGLSVILDVVYNHLGPEGNYVAAVTGGRFFTDRHQTPWGDAVDFDGPDSGPVRDFIVQNALYWLVEYRVDGLRLDATHAILDDSHRHILAEIAEVVRAIPGPPRILIAEDERNEERLLRPRDQDGFGFDAVWADDLHHQIRRAVAGDRHGYFARYAGTTNAIAETLRRGWWRGEDVETGADDERRPPISPSRFVHCIQNHDQVGNRAMGERLNHEIDLSVYRAISTLLLLSPYTPLIWMGQEWAASSPFQYFTDHPAELGALVSAGRLEEFGQFPAFSDPYARVFVPDPQAESTFLRSKLLWTERDEQPFAGVLDLYTTLLQLRRAHPALRIRARKSFTVESLGEGALALRREAGNDTILTVVNLRGEISCRLNGPTVLSPPAVDFWKPLLTSEQPRFGGTGVWGTLERDGTLHLRWPCAMVLASGASA